jgi:hypothetical protein
MAFARSTNVWAMPTTILDRIPDLNSYTSAERDHGKNSKRLATRSKCYCGKSDNKNIVTRELIVGLDRILRVVEEMMGNSKEGKHI